MKNIMGRIREYLNRKAVRRKLRRAVSILSCIVVFGTTYALLLPALTLEAETVCGMEEHEHTEDCFSRVLICGQEESDGHQHSQECYDADGNLICGQEESEGHHHTDDCYEMQLTCDKEVHVHSEECYKHEDAPAADEADTAEIAQEEEADNGSTEGNTSESSAASTEAAAAATKEAAKETAKTAEPEKLKEIRLERFLTGRSGIYYIPENGGSDDWVELGSDDRLDPEQDAIVHIAFEIPAGKLNATNARTEYELPLSISMTEDEVRDINNYESRVFIGTDREANDLGDAGSFEIEEEYDGDGDVTERRAMIRFNADTCKLVGGEKLTDGTVTAQPESIEGFIEMTISAQDLLTLKAVGEASYVLEWNDDSSLDTYVNFDADKLQAFLDEKNGKDEEASEAETAEESAVAAATEEIAITEEEAVTEEEASEDEPVQEEAPTASYASGKLDYDGGSYTVTASFDESAQLPEGVRLNVKELTGASYQKYLSEANEAVGEKKEVTGGRFFDITFTDAEGKPVEPQGMVDVCITYKNTETIEEGTSVEGVHFTDEGAQTIDVDAKGVAENTVDVVGFTSDSFSVYGVVYTVDFEYTDPITGAVYYYTLKGGKSISLTDLLMVMGVKSKDAAIEFVANQVENVEFSAPELVKVTHNGKILGIFGKEDWVLESLQPFDTQETLTITLKNGAAIIVKVTDEQEGVWDLADSGNVDFLHVTAESSVTETEQERDAAFRLNVSYGLKEDVVKAIDAYTGNPVTLVYDISSTLANSPLKDEIRCKGTISIGNRKLGTYREENGKIYLEFTDTAYFNDKTSFTGYFQLTVQTDERELGDSDEYTYEFPGTSDTVPIHYKKTVEEGSKTVSDNKDADGNYTLHYTANVNVNSDLNTLTFNDTLGGLQTLDASSVKINGRPVTVSQSGKNFSFDVGTALGTSGVAKGSYQVTYDTKLTAEQLSQMSGDKTTETNVVTWKVNGSKDVPGGQTEREYHKPHEPVPVSKVITDGRTTHNPGDTISYQITYGDSNTDLAGFEIYDSMTDLQTLQGGITISYNGTTTTMPSSAIAPADSTYSTNMVTLFDYTFPDNTQGKGPVVVTYTTKVIDADTAKANGIYDTKELSNLAQEKRYDTTDIVKTNVPFEKEKQVTVDKTAQAAPTDESGSWVPGSKINYTLTVGDANTDMSGVHIWDEMTDLQTLEGTVKIKVGNGSVINLTDYISNAMTYEDDGQYSSNNVKLFDFVMPNNCGNGPVVITYTTKVISDDTANANGIYGDAIIKNTGHGGPGSDGTEGPVIFGEYPIDKEVTQNGTDVNGQTVDMDSTVHYKLTLGDQHTNLKGAVIYDEMTDIQKVVSSITITN